jgi:phage terminase large subunit
MLRQSFARKVDYAYNSVFSEKRADITIDTEKKEFHLLDDDDKSLYYKPVPTAIKFHSSNLLVRGIIGPYGSSKTTSMLAEIIFRSAEMPIYNGKRYSRWAIIRNTYAELESTTYVSWMSWFATLGRVKRNKKPLLTVRHEFNDGKGDIELEILFIALDSESDIRKLKSLEVSGLYINETSEIPYPIFEHSISRAGRFMLNVYPKYFKTVIFDTNPPNERHWIFKKFETENIDDFKLFHQPPGLLKDKGGKWIANLECDNIERLGDDYYLRMINNTEEFIKVYALGQYGSVITGKKVYPEYNDDMHSNNALKINVELDTYVGIDFGLTPSAIFVQTNVYGQYLCVKELIAERLGIEQFIELQLLPFLSQSGVKVTRYIGDPAGKMSSQTDLKSCFDIFGQFGLHIDGAITNNITPRLEAVRVPLNRLIDGRPQVQISREGCPHLREGMLGGYQYKKLRIGSSNEEIYDNKPDKNTYSHIHDALQYIFLHINNQYKIGNQEKLPIRKMRL